MAVIRTAAHRFIDSNFFIILFSLHCIIIELNHLFVLYTTHTPSPQILLHPLPQLRRRLGVVQCVFANGDACKIIVDSLQDVRLGELKDLELILVGVLKQHALSPAEKYLPVVVQREILSRQQADVIPSLVHRFENPFDQERSVADMAPLKKMDGYSRKIPSCINLSTKEAFISTVVWRRFFT